MAVNNTNFMSKIINKHNADLQPAYYNRVMSTNFEKLIMKDYKWLIEFVKKHHELDFQTGFDQKQNKSWFSVYRGTSRILQITYYDKSGRVTIDAAESYMKLGSYPKQLDEKHLEVYLKEINENPNYGKYYIDLKEDRKEGYYQTRIARRYTFENKNDDDFVIFDKELVIGFKDEHEKAAWNKTIIDSQKEAIETLRTMTSDKLSERIKPYYGEFDFMGLSWDGDLIIMELKKEAKGTKSSLAPIQIAYYVKQFTKLMKEDTDGRLYKVITDMILQKQRMGLIKMAPKAKSLPNGLSGKIRKYIIMGDDEKVSKPFKEHFVLAKKVFLENDLEVFTCDKNDGTLRLSSQFI